MNFSNKQLEEIIHNQLGNSTQLIATTPTQGGDINQAWKITTNQGNYFLKTNLPYLEEMFKQEYLALEIIKSSQTIHCPSPIGYGKNSSISWLLMEFIELTQQGDDFLRGQQLAKMHQTSAENFGWHSDNFIGKTPQYNQENTNWTSFYANQRLKPQLKLAQENNASKQLQEKGQQLIESLDEILQDHAPLPSLLHGDLWGGNSAFTPDGTPVIYDPASYYGDRETDLAMTEMFGGFSQDFYQGYNSIYPLDSGYAHRKTLYNLYHQLNHFNLFGGGYQQASIRAINQLLN